MNWLINAAEKAGWRASIRPQIAPGASLREAWDLVAQSYVVSELELSAGVASLFHMDVALLDTVEPHAVKLVPEKLARKFHIIPIRESQNEIVIATCDPTDYNAEHAVQFTSGRRVVQQIAGYEALLDCINAHYSPGRAIEDLLRSMDVTLTDVKVESEFEEPLATDEAEAEPVNQLANMVLHAAVACNASDIHLEPGRHQGVVWFRVDGVMRQYMQLPLIALTRVASRIKMIARLDIADWLHAQDGRTRVSIAGKTLDMRISTVPARDAEKVVIRILDPDTSRSLDDLGLADHELARLRYLLAFREGLVVVTGPAGSGKTTTLYGCLRELAAQAIDIITVEDPVEYELPAVTQIQIDPRRDITFASALREILRQDPDVVFVGEIRDEATAKVALQAAATGHLVLSTLHTDDAVGAVQRLLDFGLDRSALAPALRGVIGQRLIRRLCSACSAEQPEKRDDSTARLERAFGVRQARRAVGCRECGETGYRGRIPIDEVLVSNPDIQEGIVRGVSTLELQHSAERGGMHPMLEVALAHIVVGNTTLDEVERVLGDDESSAERVDERARILVADDDAVSREVAVGVLQAAGFAVDQATDGQAALDMLARDSRYSLVTLDLDMPRVDGRAVLRRLRSTAATSGLPIIMLTGNDSEETEMALMNEGADDYLRKPLDPARFIARVRAVLRRATS